MISFICSSCNRIISVDEKYSGRKGRCPKCKGIVVVPERSNVIVFNCESCGHKIKVPDKYGGKKGKCPKCHEPVIIPPLEKDQVVVEKMVSVTCQMCGQVIEIPEHASETFTECPSCGSYVETFFGDAMVESHTPIQPPAGEQQYEEESEEYEDSEGVDRRVITIVAYTAAGAVLALIILAAVLRLARPRRQREFADTGGILTQLELDEVKTFTERYIRLLENGEVDQALQLHSPGFTGSGFKSQIDLFSRQIGISRITSMNCTQIQCEPQLQEDRILLWYNLAYDSGGQSFIFSVIRIKQKLMIDGIATWRTSDRPFVSQLNGTRHPYAAGPKTQDALRTAVIVEYEKSESFYSKLFFGFLIAILVFGLIQIVSMWIVFEKDGRPGWASIVPFYNMWVLAEIGGKSGWIGLLMCFTGLIPFIGNLIGFVLWFIISLGVAKTFGRGVLFGIGLALLSWIFYPILAFSKG